jgi:MoxR-like ATPase
MKTAQALALFDKYDFVAPEHIQDLAGPVIAHRLVLDPQAKFSGADAEGIVEEIIRSLPVPA